MDDMLCDNELHRFKGSESTEDPYFMNRIRSVHNSCVCMYLCMYVCIFVCMYSCVCM